MGAKLLVDGDDGFALLVRGMSLDCTGTILKNKRFTFKQIKNSEPAMPVL